MKKIYLVRHCQAQGQVSEAPLTEKGHQQALHLVEFFFNTRIDQIVSSPFSRAIQTIEPVARDKKVNIEVDTRLSERILSTMDMPNWFENLKRTFTEMELKFEGGESSKEATNRILAVIDDLLYRSDAENIIIVTHGNLMALLLKHYLKDFGFDQWNNLTNPDVFELNQFDSEIKIERIWKEN